MKLIKLPASLREYFNCFIFEPADDITMQNIQLGLRTFYPEEQLTIELGVNRMGCLDISLVFDTEADAMLFILRNPV